MIVEQTLGLLKGRFRILLSINESSIPTVNVITMACCILHNMCIVREVTLKYGWILARKDVHSFGNNVEDDLDIVERYLPQAYNAKNIRKPLTHLFQSHM